MTVCIAAISIYEHVIVTVSDTMLSNDQLSADSTALKIRPVVNGWAVMYAGLPGTFESLVRHMNRWFTKKRKPKTVDSMMAAIGYAYDCEFEYYVNRHILSHLCMTLDEFKKDGLRQLGKRVVSNLNAKMDAAAKARDYDPNGTVLMALGFDNDGIPHIVVSSSAGVCTDHSTFGYHAIGTGDWLAIASLQSRKRFRSIIDLGEFVYYVHAARFDAENAPTVGDKITVTTIHRAKLRSIQTFSTKASREFYDIDKGRAVPDETIHAIEVSVLGGPHT